MRSHRLTFTLSHFLPSVGSAISAVKWDSYLVLDFWEEHDDDKNH